MTTAVISTVSTASEDLATEVILNTWRVPPHMVFVYSIFYAAIFFLGLVGNCFVVVAIISNNTLRSATDYMIASLALADLLVVIFCLPITLLNNLLTEWQLGSYGCKLSTFINATTSCASIFTLVGVTADRYLAICHSLKYSVRENNCIIYLIIGIWIISGGLASPNFFIYNEVLYQLLPSSSDLTDDGTVTARLCVSTEDEFLLFIIVNLIIAFLLPVFIICISYALIFRTVTKHTNKKLAVDNNARSRDERVKLRIAQMMLTVIVVFVVCWTPLYVLYCYFFLAPNRNSSFFQFASSVLRPIFQWLSLLSSSLNPLIYIAFSQKYRRAFHSLLLLPCRDRYEKFHRATRETFRVDTTKEIVGTISSFNYSTKRHENKKCSFDAAYYTTTSGCRKKKDEFALGEGRKSSLQCLPNNKYRHLMKEAKIFHLTGERDCTNEIKKKIQNPNSGSVNTHDQANYHSTEICSKGRNGIEAKRTERGKTKTDENEVKVCHLNQESDDALDCSGRTNHINSPQPRKPPVIATLLYRL